MCGNLILFVPLTYSLVGLFSPTPYARRSNSLLNGVFQILLCLPTNNLSIVVSHLCHCGKHDLRCDAGILLDSSA